MILVPDVVAKRVTIGGQRFYEIDGRLYPSVTTVLSVVGKPALVKWARRVALDFVRDSIQSETVTKEELHAILEKAMDEPERIRDAAADRGSAAHEGLAERVTEGVGHESATLSHLGLTVVRTEVMVYSQRGFAGTTDVVAVDRDGNLVVIDWKTGGVWPEHALQIGAYSIAIAEMTGMTVGSGYVIGLKDRQPVVHRVRIESARRGFLAALDLYLVLREEGLLSVKKQ